MNNPGSRIDGRLDRGGCREVSRRDALSTLLQSICLFCSPATLRAAAAPPASGELNRALDQGFGKRTGAGVVVDVSGGRILASHNPEVAAQRLVLPGSTLKTFTLLALLEAGKLRPDENFLCPNKLEIAGHRLDCPHPANLGPITPSEALAYSCNNFFAQMALRLAPEAFARSLRQHGFGSVTHLALQEASGRIETAHSDSELQLQAIGEFGIHVTPLELLQAFRRLAQRRSAPEASTQPLASVYSGLETGTVQGMAAAVKTEGMAVGGKTGTALADEGHWTHGWFAGYAPAEAPEIALVIFLERGNGPVDAVGIAHGVFSAYRDAQNHG